MKKLSILIATLLIMCGCDRELTDYHSGYWKVSNLTQQPLILKYPLLPDAEGRIIAPNETVIIRGASFYPRMGETPYFSKFYEEWVGDPSAIVQVFTTNHELLRTWSLEEKDQPGKQLFNEMFWKRTEVNNKRGKFQDITWVFEIVPEDLE